MGRRAIAAAPAWQEFDLLRRIRRQFGRLGPGDRIGQGDDASVHAPRPGTLEITTCDALVEHVHWRPGWCTPSELGAKTAAVNCSDIAAMGGRPERAYLVLALPRGFGERPVLDLVRGLHRELARYGARLSGGDTVASPGPLMLALTLQGVVTHGRPALRSGARPGDRILVTGQLGGAAAGWRLLAQDPSWRAKFPRPVRCWVRPVPRLAEGQWLARQTGLHAMLDVSDGLAGDLRRLAEASRVGVRIRLADVPVHPATRRAAQHLGQDALDLAVQGGEDYELLIAAAPSAATRIREHLRAAWKTPCTDIGEVVPAGQGLSVIAADGRRQPLPRGWEHA